MKKAPLFGLFGILLLLAGTSKSTLGQAQVSPRSTKTLAVSDAAAESKADSFLATNPSVVRTIVFINEPLDSPFNLSLIGQHYVGGDVYRGRSSMHLKDDSNGHLWRFAKFETLIMENMPNGSIRTHVNVATAFQDDLNLMAIKSSGGYVLVPCKTGKNCVDNKLTLSDSYDQPPPSMPGLGRLLKADWAPPTVLAIGPFPEGQAKSMVPVVKYLLSKRLVVGLAAAEQDRDRTY